MALRCTSPCFTVSRATPKSYIKVVMLPTRCHVQPKKVIKPFIFSSTASKIYEDKAMRIVGYIDESGEQIYEGYDEGPRLTHEDLQLANNKREARTLRHIQKDAGAVLSAQYQKMKS
ncbi:uncharacterized protein LOC144559736 [Carex rostrata]